MRTELDQLLEVLRRQGLNCTEHIGSGGICDVFRATEAQADLGVFNERAVKVSRGTTGGNQERNESEHQVADRLEKEFDRLKEISSQIVHDHIVRFFGILKVPAIVAGRGEHVVSVWELCESDLQKSGGPLLAGEILTLLGQVATALDHLHRCRIVHRDVKESNILLCNGGQTAKIGDLGLAHIGTQSLLPSKCGTPGCTDPHQFSDRVPDATSDRYALATSYVRLVHGVDIFSPIGQPNDSTDITCRQWDADFVARAIKDLRDNHALTEVEAELIHAALRVDPTVRYQGSTRDWIDAIRAENQVAQGRRTLPNANQLGEDLAALRADQIYDVIRRLQVPIDTSQAWPRETTERAARLLEWANSNPHVGIQRLTEVFWRVAKRQVPARISPITGKFAELGITNEIQKRILHSALGMNDPGFEIGNPRDVELCAITCAKQLAHELKNLLTRVTTELDGLLAIKLPNWGLTAEIPDGTTLVSEGLPATITAVNTLRARLDRYQAWSRYGDLAALVHRELDALYGRIVQLVSRSHDRRETHTDSTDGLGELIVAIRNCVSRARDLCPRWEEQAADLHRELCQHLRQSAAKVATP